MIPPSRPRLSFLTLLLLLAPVGAEAGGQAPGPTDAEAAAQAPGAASPGTAAGEPGSAGVQAAPTQGPAGTLVVANRRGGSVSFFDLELGVEVARLPVGPRIPHEVAVSPNGRWALTGEYGSGDEPGRRLVVFDLTEARERGRIDLGERSRPHSMAFLPGGRRAVATMEMSDRLALVDA
nr:hypothetical protein [Gemmatimonadota bacterium]NIR80724.1 hypothetical protein [Gemmatimonadota bacterium]NIT89530.1 hypothetical protein [Gemmatimonadota bacterium]NIU33323.1 hypothetical protein [Gemmatimonadota bacterium]NIU37613.1 hypothetical protein [Gemmatimonadota bacterium]